MVSGHKTKHNSSDEAPSSTAGKQMRSSVRSHASRAVDNARKSERSYVILVVGMHRSGTSAVTRVLNFLGAALPDNLLPPLPNNNDAGFWESRKLWELHEKLLDEISSSWDDPTPFPENWLQSPAALSYKEKFTEFLNSELCDAPLSTIKDPRICRFLDLWKLSIEEVGRTPLVVIPYRDPVEVAWSLKERDQIPTAQSYLMWLRHVLLAERDSRNIARTFVDYGLFLDNWLTNTNRISSQLGIIWPANVLKANNDIDAFLERRQRHHVHASEALEDRDDVPEWVKRIYKILPSLVANPTDPDAIKKFNCVRAEVSKADAAFSPVLRSYRDTEVERRKQMTSIDKQLQRLRVTLTDKDNELKRVYATLTDIQNEKKHLDLKIEERFREIAKMTRILMERDRDLEQYKGSQAALKNELKQLKNSASWRLTKPFRIAKSLLKRFGKENRELRQNHKLLAQSDLVDISWYLRMYPDVAEADYDPIDHYLRYGAKECRDPGPRFSTTSYLGHYPDVAAAKINPLVHFLQHGRKEGRSIHPALLIRDTIP